MQKEFSYECFNYTILDDGTAAVTDYVGEDINVIIPGEMEGLPVTEISVRAFEHKEEILSVTLPSTVRKIGDHAFAECISLEKINLPASLKIIGDGAFFNCSHLTDINVPETVKEIGEAAFLNCGRLADECGFVIFRDVLYCYCGDAKDVVIPNGVKTVGCYSFSANYSLESVALPDSVSKIEGEAFSGCKNLRRIDIPNVDCDIEDLAFSECPSLADKDGFLIVNDILFDYYGNAANIVISDRVRAIAGYAFCNQYKSSVETVVLPEGLQKLGAHAFRECVNLHSINVPDSLTEIGEDAFRRCPLLADENGFVIIKSILFGYFGNKASITVPDGIEVIGAGAFINSKNLISLRLPNSLKIIGESAFAGCRSLVSINVPAHTKMENEAFRYCSGLADKKGFIIVNDVLFEYTSEAMSETVRRKTDGEEKTASDIIIPEGVKELSEGAFYFDEDNPLLSVLLPRSLEWIDPQAFLFSGRENVILHVYENSVGERFAKEKHISYSDIH